MSEQASTECNHKEVVYLQPAYPQDFEDDDINLIDLWKVLWKGKWLISFIVCVFTLFAGYIAFFYLPVTYQSNAVLLETKQDKSSMSALSGVLGSLPLPIALPGGSQTGIVSFLESRSLKERLISKYELLPVLYEDAWDAKTKTWIVETPDQEPTLIKALQSGILNSLYNVAVDKKSGLITVSWEDESPDFCKLMLDRVISELTFFLDNEYISSARREREFVEKQLEKATRDLEYWERQIPSEKLTLAHITRERLAAQTVYTELRKQLELAKISEAKENISFKVLDEPFVPEYKFKPKRKRIVLLAFAGSIFFAVFCVFLLNFIRNAKTHDEDGQSVSGTV